MCFVLYTKCNVECNVVHCVWCCLGVWQYHPYKQGEYSAIDAVLPLTAVCIVLLVNVQSCVKAWTRVTTAGTFYF